MEKSRVDEWTDLIDQCYDNYDGGQNPLMHVGRKVLYFSQYRKGTVFEMEEIIAEVIFGMEEVKLASKQRSMN